MKAWVCGANERHLRSVLADRLALRGIEIAVVSCGERVPDTVPAGCGLLIMVAGEMTAVGKQRVKKAAKAASIPVVHSGLVWARIAKQLDALGFVKEKELPEELTKEEVMAAATRRVEAKLGDLGEAAASPVTSALTSPLLVHTQRAVTVGDCLLGWSVAGWPGCERSMENVDQKRILHQMVFALAEYPVDRYRHLDVTMQQQADEKARTGAPGMIPYAHLRRWVSLALRWAANEQRAMSAYAEVEPLPTETWRMGEWSASIVGSRSFPDTMGRVKWTFEHLHRNKQTFWLTPSQALMKLEELVKLEDDLVSEEGFAQEPAKNEDNMATKTINAQPQITEPPPGVTLHDAEVAIAALLRGLRAHDVIRATFTVTVDERGETVTVDREVRVIERTRSVL